MKPTMKAIIAAALLVVNSLAAATTAEDRLLEKVRTGQMGNRAQEEQMLTGFRSADGRTQQQMLNELRRRRDRLQQASQQLEETARQNDKVYKAKVTELRSEMGPNATLFGSLQQLSTDLIGVFRSSPTSMEFAGRESWLTAFSERMAKSSEIFSIEELEHVWFLLQQEITASGKTVMVSTEVLGESGHRENRAVTRVGKFVLITDDPQPAYLSWEAETQRASVLKRQPEGQYLSQVESYLTAGSGVQALGIDPTGGSLLSRLVDAPDMKDRIAAGGLIGNLILTLGAVGVTVALLKLLSIMLVSAKVAAQRGDLANPSSSNPLGRMLKIYEANKNLDTETLEMRLGEAILEERPKIDRFVGLIKVISVVAPLMGLMGTVIGMIATFQAITLFGTGDPKTMAGGISQALVTTVEGLTVAIPTVLLHAIVSSRAMAVINTLKHQTAGLIAERMEARG